MVAIYCIKCETKNSSDAISCSMCKHPLVGNKPSALPSPESKTNYFKSIKKVVWEFMSKDRLKRTRTNLSTNAPSYFGIRFISGIFIVFGSIAIIAGLLGFYLNPTQATLAVNVIFTISGIVTIGIGQMFSAFRDLVINSYIVAHIKS